MPVYRHPADECPALVPFTPTVVQIKDEVEKVLGHPLNHVLIQLYRDGNDYISEHSDKTLDIVPRSFICNVSLGAERTMVFRTKRADKDPSRKARAGRPDGEGAGPGDEDPSTSPPETDAKREIVRARLPHNSLCRMGLKTNMRWHARHPPGPARRPRQAAGRARLRRRPHQPDVPAHWHLPRPRQHRHLGPGRHEQDARGARGRW